METAIEKIISSNAEVIVLYPDRVKEEQKITFWYREGSRINIDSRLFIKVLNQLGFRIYRTGKDYIYVHIENMIVEETCTLEMKESVREYIMGKEGKGEGGNKKEDGGSKKEAEMVLSRVISQSALLFSRSKLEYLDKLEDDFNRDTRTESFIYFRNCFVKITERGYTAHSYEELEKCIWKKQVIDRDFYETEGVSDFRTFIFRVCRNDAERFDSLRSVIGYLLHGYKDPAMAKAVIFMDEKLDSGSNGGCGKSLLGNALSKVRKSLRLGGKNFRFDRFSFQSYEPGVDIIEFNDLHRNFQFEMLFTAITDNIVVEKKNRDEMLIPFEHSPKMLLSTNYTIQGVDESTLRRQFIIEFSDYFNMRYTPEDEFGRRFFEDWCNDDWCRFYKFMISCLQFYLKHGLVDYRRINLEQKKLLQATSEEFLEFAEELKPATWYGRKETFNRFLKIYPDYGKTLQQKTFAGWIKIFARLKGYKLMIRKSGADRLFILKILGNEGLNEDII